MICTYMDICCNYLYSNHICTLMVTMETLMRNAEDNERVVPKTNVKEQPMPLINCK